MKNKIKKIISIYVIASMLVISVVPVAAVNAVGESQPSADTMQETNQDSTVVESSPTPTQNDSPQTTEVETAATSSVGQAETESTSTQTTSAVVVSPTPTPDPRVDRDGYKAYQEEQARAEALAALNPAGSSASGNAGETSLATGDGNNSATVATSGNTNTSVSPSSFSEIGDESSVVLNDENGSGSANTGTASSTVVDSTNQNNSALVGSSLNQGTTTGESSASFNVGDTNLTTGNANTSGTAITSVNTNMDGVMVSEFNVIDNHKGDIILSDAALLQNCISGCPGGAGTATNVGNGADTTNNSTSTANTTDNTNQNNTAGVGNNMTLDANSGDNKASFNGNGDTTLTTGDANISANSLTFANNNLSGNVTYAVVNIYGDLEGDIVLPEFTAWDAGANGTTATNTNNDASSTNNAIANSANTDNTFQNNDATIANTLVLDTNTGENDASANTGGDTTIKTGNTNIDANVLNVANSNLDGGTWYLVLVNVAGRWIGRLIGSPEGSTMAGSEGTEFEIGSDGAISASLGAVNDGNGAGSENNATATSTNTSNTTQNNTANINNTLNLSANTGGNSTSYNTGGDSTINTGNANIIANLVNFVNNNITGGGRLVVTVINVFGSWLGDFVGPGQTKNVNNNTQVATGGVQNVAPADNQDNGASTENVGSASTSIGDTITTSVSKAAAASFRQMAIVGNSSNNVISENLDNAPQKVAGISTDKGESVTKKNNITINLAWLLMAVPVVGAIVVTRKLARVKLFAKNA
jgi:hypothetical protein